MKNKLHVLIPAIAVLIASIASAGADTKNYAWNGSTNVLPGIYVGGDTAYPAAGGTYAMASGRLSVSSPGNNGWIGNQFDWDGSLANDEKVSGSLTFRIDSYNNGGGLGRVRLFWFNATYANGLNAFLSLYGSDKLTTRNSDGGWHTGGQSEWNKWEYNPSDAGAAAPAGQTYVYNSFNMNDPATDPTFFKALTNGTDHVLSWSARYLADSDVVEVTTALDGVAWTKMYVNRCFNNLGWGENALAKQHGSMQGPWDAEFSHVDWATTTLPAPAADTKNYSWDGLTGSIPPLYAGGDVNYPAAGGSYSNACTLGMLHVNSPGNNGWIGNQFDWVGNLADSEKVSGSVTFRINSYNNGPGANLGRVRLFWFNVPFTNGLNAFLSLYGSDKLTTRNSDGGWHAGGQSEWNKWEYNPSDAGAAAPAGETYVYNSFNMNDPATDPTFFKALVNGTDHVLSWSAQYVASDTVRVTTALDGVAWTTIDVNRNYNNLGWAENALAKQHGSMQGPWDAEFTQVNWATGAAAPSVAIVPWTGGQVRVNWPIGTLYEATSLSGPWTPVVATSPYTTAVSGKKFYRAQ